MSIILIVRRKLMVPRRTEENGILLSPCWWKKAKTLTKIAISGGKVARTVAFQKAQSREKTLLFSEKYNMICSPRCKDASKLFIMRNKMSFIMKANPDQKN
mmetsp:Transcript_12919/g.18528  ORF Transcript_12919/g.18528 Transcript_12919/m.18528 type:complete len:101 (+) Transcript_12919:1615-1917(+)